MREPELLAPLLGACGFQQASPIAKARADLTGLLYADGVHDSLCRSGGVSLIRAAAAPVPQPHARHRWPAPSAAA